MKFKIRDATDMDGEVIAEFNSRMAEETEDRPLRQDLIGPGVASILGDTAKGRYWVAETDREIVGQIMVTYEWSDWRNATIWWIQSVYVQPQHRRSGVFSSLYRHVKNAAHDDNACGLRLYVEHNNEQAQKIYKSLGMIDSNYRVMQTIFGDVKC